LNEILTMNLSTSRSALAASLLAIGLLIAPSASHAQHSHAPAAQPAAAPETRAGDLTLTAPWTRATPGGARVAGGYLVIRNRGTTPDRLTGGSLERAGRVEIHEMAVEAGIMRMRALGNGLVIPPGGAVELKPGGLHVMFLDLTAPLKQGETVKGTLIFERAGRVDVEYTVGAIGAGPDGHHGAGHGGPTAPAAGGPAGGHGAGHGGGHGAGHGGGHGGGHAGPRP
jgi:hypothetical protein